MQQEESKKPGNYDPIPETPTHEPPIIPGERKDLPDDIPCFEEPSTVDTGILISPDGWDNPWETPGDGNDSDSGLGKG